MSARGYDVWRGSVEQSVEEHERRLNSINGNLDRIEERLNSVLIKVGIAAGLGGILAAPVIGAIVWALTT